MKHSLSEILDKYSLDLDSKEIREMGTLTKNEVVQHILSHLVDPDPEALERIFNAACPVDIETKEDGDFSVRETPKKLRSLLFQVRLKDAGERNACATFRMEKAYA